MAKLVDSGTAEVLVPDKIGVSVDNGTIGVRVENPVVEVAFWKRPVLGRLLGESPLLSTEGTRDGSPVLKAPLGEYVLPETGVD